MVARGHFTVEALEAAKLAKLARLEDWYEAPWTPADTAPAETEGLSTPPVTPTTHSAKELIESGYLAKVVLGDDSEELHEVTPPGTPTAQSPRRIANKAYWKERADTMVSRLFPFEDLPQSESSGLAAGSGSDDSSFSHASGRRNLLAVINQILKIVPLHETEIRRSLNLHHASNLYRAPETHDWHSVAATLQLHYEGRTEPWIEESLAVWRGGPDLILVAENINPTL